MAQTHLTSDQIDTLVIVEKASAAVSLTGTTLILITFLSMKDFRKLSTTLIFYASFSNVLSNAAHIIGISGITAGEDSALCQFQGFLQQMFEPADVLCSLAMAINVYLAIFHQYDTALLMQLTGRYLIICYGLPFIPAFVLLFISSQDRGRVYGDATLWCWISSSWDPLRIAVFYGPIWIAMLATILIYIMVGKHVFKKGRAIRNASYGSGYINIRKTTEVRVCNVNQEGAGPNSSSASNDPPPPRTVARRDQDSDTISSLPADEESQARASPIRAANRSFSPAGLDSVTWTYTKCAALFAASLLITWVPSSANRMYTLLAGGKVSYRLNFFAALVLPLQGFWNAIIYFTTSRAVCKAAWDSRPSLFSSSSHIQLNSIGSRKQGRESTVDLPGKIPPN